MQRCSSPCTLPEPKSSTMLSPQSQHVTQQPGLLKAKAHRKVEAENGDAFGQHVEKDLLGISPAPAVACTGSHMHGQEVAQLGRQHGGRCNAGAAAPCLCSSRPCVTWLVSSHGCLAAARQASSWRRRTVAVDDAGQAAVRGGDDAGAVVGALQLQAPLVLLQQRPPSGVVGTWSRG